VNLQSVFDWLQSWPISEGIRQSSWMFPAFESVHVIAITLVVGSVMIVDLRVLGLTTTRKSVSELSWEVLPWTWGLFLIALISGAFMFAAKANAYFTDTPFRLKMLLMAAAGLNMFFFHFVPLKTIHRWDRDVQAPAIAKLSCGLSLAFWVLVVTMGRWIGFTIQG
jgi:hypothetical protein